MGFWSVVKHALNSTLGRKDFLPLDNIVKLCSNTIDISDIKIEGKYKSSPAPYIYEFSGEKKVIGIVFYSSNSSWNLGNEITITIDGITTKYKNIEYSVGSSKSMTVYVALEKQFPPAFCLVGGTDSVANERFPLRFHCKNSFSIEVKSPSVSRELLYCDVFYI